MTKIQFNLVLALCIYFFFCLYYYSADAGNSYETKEAMKLYKELNEKLEHRHNLTQQFKTTQQSKSRPPELQILSNEIISGLCRLLELEQQLSNEISIGEATTIKNIKQSMADRNLLVTKKWKEISQGNNRRVLQLNEEIEQLDQQIENEVDKLNGELVLVFNAPKTEGERITQKNQLVKEKWEQMSQGNIERAKRLDTEIKRMDQHMENQNQPQDNSFQYGSAVLHEFSQNRSAARYQYSETQQQNQPQQYKPAALYRSRQLDLP